MDKTKVKMRKLHARREATFRAAREIAVQVLAEDALEDSDQFVDRVSLFIKDVDTKTLTVKRLMDDPKVQSAFKKFCTNIVGGMQFIEEEEVF